MEIREHILTEATRLFARKGFNGTSLQSIADAVGIRKPSLLYHFPSKLELRERVLDALLSHWNEVLPRLLVASASGDRFEGVMQELILFFRTDPDRARLLVRELLDRPDDMRVRLETHVQPWLTVVSEQIQRGRDRGLMHPGVDARLYAINIIHLVVSSIAALDSLSPQDEQPPQLMNERHTAELMRFARAGIFTE